MNEVWTEAGFREALDRLEASGEALRRRSREEIAETLAEAWGRIADPEFAPGRVARQRVPESSGLTLKMVAWALSTTLGNARSELATLAARMEPPPGALEAPPRLISTILAGNVFTACVQPLSVALLCRAPVLVKASSQDDVLPRLFVEALREVDPALAEACRVVSFPSGNEALESLVLSRADVVSAYGGDETMRSLRRRLAPTSTLVAHGHGLGLGFVARESGLEEAATAFALDVAAYDQRGCMSPHAIAVEEGVDAHLFARMLSEALVEIAVDLPRGALSVSLGAQQMQWRGVGQARGGVYEGGGAAVSYEGPVAARLSPGGRNVMVYQVPDRAAFVRGAVAFGVHLKTIGVAGDLGALARSLTPPLAPRVCRAGRMQIPGLLAFADGRPAWEGFSRFIELDREPPA